MAAAAVVSRVRRQNTSGDGPFARNRVTVELSPATLARLEQGAGTPKSEVIRRALELFLQKQPDPKLVVPDYGTSRSADVPLPELRLLSPQSSSRPAVIAVTSVAVLALSVWLLAINGTLQRLPSVRLMGAGIAGTVSALLVNLVGGSIEKHGLFGTGRPFLVRYAMVAVAVILGVLAIALVTN